MVRLHFPCQSFARLLITNFRRTGQTKSLSKEERILFSKLVIALDDDDKEEIVRLMKVAGFRSRRMDPGRYCTAIESVIFIALPIFCLDVIYLYAKVGYDQDNKELTKGMHIQIVSARDLPGVAAELSLNSLYLITVQSSWKNCKSKTPSSSYRSHF
jgi:hypothetical protein